MSVTFELNVLDLIPLFLLSLHHLYFLLLTTTRAQVDGASLTENLFNPKKEKKIFNPKIDDI